MNRKGQNNGRAKLSEAQAREILTAQATYTELAERYDVSVSTVAFIRTKRRWKHLDTLPPTSTKATDAASSQGMAGGMAH
jgi:transposase-like protein